MSQEAITEIDMDVFSRRIAPYFTWLESRIESGWEQTGTDKDILKDTKHLATTMRARFILGVGVDDFKQEVQRVIALFEAASEAFPHESEEVESKLRHLTKGIAEELGKEFLPGGRTNGRIQEPPKPEPKPQPPEPEPPRPEPGDPSEPDKPDKKDKTAKRAPKVKRAKPKTKKTKKATKAKKPKAARKKATSTKKQKPKKQEPAQQPTESKQEPTPAKTEKKPKKPKGKTPRVFRWVKYLIYGE